MMKTHAKLKNGLFRTDEFEHMRKLTCLYTQFN